MFTTPATSPATATLRDIALMIEAHAPNIELCDLSLLDSIATAASQLAQDLRLSHDRDLAVMDEWEALIAAKLMAESDALDHSIGG